MRKRKGNLLQRIMASLLSAMLITGMALDAVPLTVLAQENSGGGYNEAEEGVVENPVTEEATEPESDEKEIIPESGEGAQESDGEKNVVDPATKKTEDTEELEETKKPVENPAEEGQDDVSGQESAAAEEGAGNTGSNDVQLEKPTAPQKAVRAASAAVQEGEIAPVTGEGWAIDIAGKLTIESDAGMENWLKNSYPLESEVKIVEIKEGVTSLSKCAFNNCSNLTSITIPNSVTSIGELAFGHCSNLTSITIPNSVTSIGESAFSECDNLASIVIPDNVTSIESGAFGKCTNLANIVIPDKVTSIGMGAFAVCISLTKITIPDSVTNIGMGAFAQCSNLESVIMEGSEPPSLEEMQGNKMHFTGCKFVTENTKGIKVPAGTATTYKTEWEEWAEFITDETDDTGDDLIASGEGWTLDSDGKLTIESDAGINKWCEYLEANNDNNLVISSKIITVEIKEGVTFLPEKVFYKCIHLPSITIPTTVTSIEGWAFADCYNLTAITIPNGVTSIGESVFDRCSNLTAITIPDGVTSIEDSTFSQCSSLTNIVIPDNVTKIGDFAFYDCNGLTSIVIPDNVESIGYSAFNGCSSLTEITIPDSVTSIEDSAFDGCSSLTEITIPDGVTSIGDYVFDGCSSLTEITIPDGVTSIGDYAFRGCSSLTAITIPDRVTSIGNSVFYECSELASVTMLGSEPPVLLKEDFEQTEHFYQCKFVETNTQGIKVPPGTAEAYKAAWNKYADYITEWVDDTGDDPIASGEGWTLDVDGKLTIESDTGMKNWCDTNGLLEKVITVEIREGVTSLPDNAFKNCSNLTSITIPNSVTSIGAYAFSQSKITSITIPDSVTSIGAYAFSQSKITSITIPNSVTTIGNYVFWNCSALTSITIPNKVTNIGNNLFYGCSSLVSITIPESVTSIGSGAFSKCTALENITIPSGVTDINSSAFYGCTGLTAITIPDSVTKIGSQAFSDCSKLETVTMKGHTPPTLSISATGKTEVFTRCKFVASNTKGIKVPEETANVYIEAWREWSKYITDGTDDTEGGIIASGEGWTLDGDGKLTIESDTGMVNWRKDLGDASSKVITVEIKEGVASLPDNVFNILTKLTSITIPTSVVSIGNGVFEGCEKLAGITIPDSVTNIGENVFYGCSGLSEVTLPAGMTGIGDGMFDGCSVLKDITIPESVKSIGAWAFSNCSQLTDITLPSDVTEIKYGAFQGCSNLTAITIPANVTSIGHMAFQNCEGLETVTMEGNTPPTLGVSQSEKTAHFAGCKFVTDGTKGIKVPAGTADAYKTAWTEWEDYIAGDSAPDTPSDKEKLDAAKKAVEDALKDITVNTTTTKEDLEKAIKEAVNTALEAAGIDSKDVSVAAENFVKTEATTEEAGSITANIKITSGGESVSVPVNKPIDKLPSMPADKVEAAKKAVEETVKNAIDKALADTEVTNDNAEEIAAQIAGLIPDAVTEALEAAGVGVDDIEIGKIDIQIEQASADKEGSIKVTIPVTSKEDAGLSENASVQVPIRRPGGEENPDKEEEEAKKAVEDALKNITVTNDTTPEDILDALKKVLGEDVTVKDIEELEKVDATQDAPGKLSLRIQLIINGKTIYVIVNVPIEQLSRKTGVYVRFTDYYDMDGSTPVYKYTGLAVKPAVKVYNNETLLTLGKDYTIGYKNNTKPGTAAALTVKGKGSFSGTSNAVNFKIINADIDRDTDHPTEMTVVVKTKVSPVIMNGTKKLTTKDYELEGEGLVNGKYTAATAEGETKTLTVKGKGNYAGSSFEIKVKVIEKSASGKLSVKIDKNFKPVYDGTALNLSSLFQQPQDGEGADTAADPQEPAAGVITVTDAKDKTKILKEGIDFTVVCTSNLTKAGTVKFTLTGMGAYTGSVSKSFKISPHKVTDNSRFSVTFDEEKTYEYRAAGTEVDNLVVKYLGETDADTDDKTLIPGVDYKVTYSRNKKVSGTKDAELKVTFLGNYKGSRAVQKTFKIAPAKLSSANTVVTVPDKVYSKANRAYKSVPIVTVDGATIKASNYTVSYAWATASQAADDTKYVEDNKVKITIAEGDSWAKVRVTVTPKATGSYGLAEGAVLKGEYYVRKADSAVNLTKAKVTFFNKEGTRLRSLEYNGNTFYTPQGNNAEADNAPDDPNAVYVRVEVSNAVVDPALYDVIWTNARAKGKATVVIRGTGTATDKGMAVGSKNQSVTVKAMALKGKTLKSYVDGVADVMNSFKNLFFRKQ